MCVWVCGCVRGDVSEGVHRVCTQLRLRVRDVMPSDQS